MATDPQPALDPPEVRRRLLDRRRVLVGRVTRVADALSELDTDRPAEDEEDAQEAHLEQPLLALDDAGRAELAEIDAALARLEAADYGECTRCEEPIEVERLMTLPSTRFCATCAAELGRLARRYA